MAEKKKKSIGRKILTIILSVVVGIAGVFFLWFAIWNLAKKAAFKEYYSIKTDVAYNPGLNDGYITQGCSYVESADVYMTSGYMMDKTSPSRIYTIDTEGKEHHTEIYLSEEKKCTYHFGGVAVRDDDVYVVGGNKINVLSLEDILTKDKAVIKERLDINNEGSFIYSDDTYLYVGEFNDGDKYQTDHAYTNPDGTACNAIVTKYLLSEALGLHAITPVLEFGIRDKVQGFCVTDQGHIVMDTSWGPKASHFYVYDNPLSSSLIPDQMDGITPMYFLDSRYLVKDLKAPSMAEDLDFHDGKVLYASESASNKYIYGKIFFYNHIYALDID